jgi:predicted ester cyclase
MIAEADKVAARITITGKAVKPAFGLPGSGRSFKVSGMYLVRIAGGKIVDHRGIEDAIGIMQQVVGQPGA